MGPLGDLLVRQEGIIGRQARSVKLYPSGAKTGRI
jgi:hypothetical protein